MIKTVYYCDHCNSKMSDAEVATSAQQAQHFFDSAGVLAGEVFCHDCVANAVAYWSDKTKLCQELMQEMNKRVERHKRDFFKAHATRSKMQLVSASTEPAKSIEKVIKWL